MLRKQFAVLTLIAALFVPTVSYGQKAAPADDPVSRIKDEGMNRSQAMATINYLSDVIGARRANRWTKEQLEKWGLKNAVVDPWGEFGRGWELKRFSASVTTPDEYVTFRSYPKAWSPSTNGPMTGDVVFVDATDEAGLEKYKGKLKGAIVFTAPEREVKPGFEPAASRNSDDALAKMEAVKPQVGPRPQYTPPVVPPFNARKMRFYFEEGAAILVDSGSGVDAGTIRVMGASLPPQANAGGNPFAGPRVYSKNAPATIPQLVAEVEQYNRILRLLKRGVPVKMTVDVDVKFHDDDLQGYNTIAEIPGTDLKDEVVMIGAHLDSWHSGTGATDNGAGVTVVMEAMRILQTAGLKPRRTVRVALWTGEEQGLLGSRSYVAKNFATIGDGSDNAALGALAGRSPALTKKPAYDKFAAYYNLDNGTGQIRGINMQGNESLRPIFKEWLAPFKDYNATTVTINSVGGTDHLAFDAVGLPGFQFVQDQIEYFTRTWHTTQDVSDRILEEDLKRSAVIMATFAYNSAMSDAKLPRKEDSSVASILSGFDFDAYKDEREYHLSGLNHSICGHPVPSDEIPFGFPKFLTAVSETRSDSE